MAALSSLVTSYTRYKTRFIHFSFCQNQVTETEILQADSFLSPKLFNYSMTLPSISKVMDQQLFLGTGKILFYTRWLQCMSSLAMQILLAWHFSERTNSQCMDMSKALLTSYLLTAQILKTYRKETREAGSKRNNPDQPWALRKWWKWIAVIKKHISSYHHSEGSQSHCLLCVLKIIWHSLDVFSTDTKSTPTCTDLLLKTMEGNRYFWY